MKYVVLGIQRSAGSFKADDGREVEYDNSVLQCARRATGNGREDKVAGMMVEAVKVKSGIFAQFCKNAGLPAAGDLIGAIINTSYDNRGRVEEIELIRHAAERTDKDEYADLPSA